MKIQYIGGGGGVAYKGGLEQLRRRLDEKKRVVFLRRRMGVDIPMHTMVILPKIKLFKK